MGGRAFPIIKRGRSPGRGCLNSTGAADPKAEHTNQVMERGTIHG